MAKKTSKKSKTGNWHHVAVVDHKEKQSMSLWINGVDITDPIERRFAQLEKEIELLKKNIADMVILGMNEHG